MFLSKYLQIQFVLVQVPAKSTFSCPSAFKVKISSCKHLQQNIIFTFFGLHFVQKIEESTLLLVFATENVDFESTWTRKCWLRRHLDRKIFSLEPLGHEHFDFQRTWTEKIMTWNALGQENVSIKALGQEIFNILGLHSIPKPWKSEELF